MQHTDYSSTILWTKLFTGKSLEPYCITLANRKDNDIHFGPNNH